MTTPLRKAAGVQTIQAFLDAVKSAAKSGGEDTSHPVAKADNNTAAVGEGAHAKANTATLKEQGEGLSVESASPAAATGAGQTAPIGIEATSTGKKPEDETAGAKDKPKDEQVGGKTTHPADVSKGAADYSNLSFADLAREMRAASDAMLLELASPKTAAAPAAPAAPAVTPEQAAAAGYALATSVGGQFGEKEAAAFTEQMIHAAIREGVDDADRTIEFLQGYSRKAASAAIVNRVRRGVKVANPGAMPPGGLPPEAAAGMDPAMAGGEGGEGGGPEAELEAAIENLLAQGVPPEEIVAVLQEIMGGQGGAPGGAPGGQPAPGGLPAAAAGAPAGGGGEALPDEVAKAASAEQAKAAAAFITDIVMRNRAKQAQRKAQQPTR